MKQGTQQKVLQTSPFVFAEMQKRVQGKETWVWMTDFVLHNAAAARPIAADDKTFVQDSIVFVSTLFTIQALQTQPAWVWPDSAGKIGRS